MAKGKTKLGVIAFALAFGIVWGVGMLIAGLMAAHNGYGMRFVDVMSSVYLGFGATTKGAFTGLAWGFGDAFVGGAIFAIIYNLCLCCCGGCKKDAE